LREPLGNIRNILPEVKVSTIIAAYNAERTIAETLESALMQNCVNQEIVVVDDGSKDSTAAILAQFGDRIRVVNQKNQGSGAARNNGVAHARGTYVAFLDSDDLWLPKKLAISVSALEGNPRASLAFSEYSNFDKAGTDRDGSAIGHAPSLEELMDLWLPPILTSTWVIPREIFERSGGFEPGFKGGQGFEDSWMLLLLRELGEFIYIPDRLTMYRLGDDSESADKYAIGLNSFIALARNRYGEKSNALVRNAKNLQCRWLLTKIAHQMDRGDGKGAICSLLRIGRLQPTYFFSSEFIKRLLLSHNMKRARDLTATLRRAHD
jgi:glycosyltransferase involved in cell wall biosynthesis